MAYCGSAKAGANGIKESPVLREAHTRIKMRTVQGIAQVIVETARSGIGPVQHFVDRPHPHRFRVESTDFLEPLHQPCGLGNLPLYRVEIGAAVWDRWRHSAAC